MPQERIVRLADIEAFRHDQDGYYYRPLLFGDNLFMYVAHVPPGGEMPPDLKEARLHETALFMLEGELEISDGFRTFNISAEEALRVPVGTAFGVRNHSDRTASFVLSFSPPVRLKSLQQFRDVFTAENREFLSAEEANNLRYGNMKPKEIKQ
ncbi:hypothetical protein ACFLSG_01890 [Candidatus Bipolaricaulota bacterium]